MTYQDFKDQFISTGDFTLLDAYIKKLEDAWESAELRADQNYSEVLRLQSLLDEIPS